MNFIKKKLKGHKKDDEEEEYEKAVYEQSLHPQKQEPMKNTEEWQFFQQLSMKVQDTVQKTQTTLNKLKDTRPEDALNDDDNFYDLESELHKATPPYGTSKVLRAPPRPPPPAGDKSSNPIDLDFGSDFSHSTIPKGPPRPPPPGASDSSFAMDSSALYGTQSKGFASPARPPPPSVKKIDSTNVSEFLPLSGSLSSNENSTGKGAQTASFSLLEEFGFKSEPITTTNTNFQDLLFLDDKEEVDPFDTSFVDVKNIASSITLTAERKGSIAKEKVPEKSFNPFCSNSGTSNEWSSSIHSDKNKKSITNPFFTATDENKTESSIDSQSVPTFNPFSFNTAISSSNNHDDLFGITVGTSSSKDDLNENLFSKTDELLTNTADYDYEKNFVNPAFNGSEPSHVGNIMDDLMNTDQDSVSDITYPQNIMKSTCKWESDKSEDLNTFVSESCEISVLPDKPLQPSSIWGASNDILKPEKIPTDEQIKPAEEERRMSEVSEFNLLRKNSSQANGFDEELEGSVKALDITIDENMFTEKSNQTSAEINQEENWAPKEKLEIHPTLLKEDTSDKIISAPDSFDMAIPGENVDSIEIKQQPTYANDFSKPFDEENKDDAFLFKVKSTDKKSNIEFDAFAAKFESAKDIQGSESFDPFLSKRAPALKKLQDNYKGFESMDEFDPFKITIRNEDFPNTLTKELSRDSFEDYDNEVDFSVVIKPKVKDSCDVKLSTMEPPKLLPPPKTPTKAFELPASRFNPFDKDFLDSSEISKATEKVIETVEADDEPVPALGEAGVRKADSVESPLSPLFDEDTSLPLEIFPKPYDKEGWEMVLRQPNKKKLTGNRFWKKIFVKLSENSVLQLFNKFDDKLPFQELPLQACYSLSEIGAQQYDQYGKIFTVKLQYKFYRERVGVRPGQISKVTQGQVTTMGDVAKLGLPLQHSAQTSQLIKIGSQYYSDIQYFIQEVEDALFRMTIHRDRVLTYKTEEVQVIAQDEFYVEQSKTGHIDKQLARVRIFFLAFITAMPSVEVGLNDIIRQGKEVVGRYDIIPVVTEEWIRLEDCEFHSCVIQDEFYKSRVIKFHPPDACLFELLRFRIRPPKNRELPLQVRVFMTVSNTRVEIRSDILVPGYSSRKQGQVPCENIQIRFPMPECWIYLFRTEKHFRYGSKKSTARRPGKIKGLERIIGAAQNLDPSLIEVSAGQAKYEHVFHAVVWRIPRLPKEGQGAYTQQLFLLRTELTSFDQIPETFEQFVDVEFTMPATYVSHTTVRSVSVTNPIPPEKYVRYVSKHEYKVEIDFKKSSDEIDGLMAASNVSVPVSSTPPVQESTEDEDKDDSD